SSRQKLAAGVKRSHPGYEPAGCSEPDPKTPAHLSGRSCASVCLECNAARFCSSSKNFSKTAGYWKALPLPPLRCQTAFTHFLILLLTRINYIKLARFQKQPEQGDLCRK